MSGVSTETRQGIGALAELVSQMATVREASPVDTGAATIAHISQRLATIERRIQTLEARR